MKNNIEEKSNDRPKKIPRWIVFVLFGILVLLLSLLGFGMNHSSSEPLTIGEPVPSFRLNLFDGRSINSADLFGKVIVVNFWASWCTTCAEEARALEESWQGYSSSGHVVFLGVAYADPEQDTRAYLQKYAVSYPNGPDLRGELSQTFHVTGVPETFVIDQQGILRDINIGPFQSTEEIHAIIDALNK